MKHNFTFWVQSGTTLTLTWYISTSFLHDLWYMCLILSGPPSILTPITNHTLPVPFFHHICRPGCTRFISYNFFKINAPHYLVFKNFYHEASITGNAVSSAAVTKHDSLKLTRWNSKNQQMPKGQQDKINWRDSVKSYNSTESWTHWLLKNNFSQISWAVYRFQWEMGICCGLTAGVILYRSPPGAGPSLPWLGSNRHSKTANGKANRPNVLVAKRHSMANTLLLPNLTPN